MKMLKILIEGIPAIIWGEASEKVYIHVHGKMSRKEYAEAFAEIAEKISNSANVFMIPGYGRKTMY